LEQKKFLGKHLAANIAEDAEEKSLEMARLPTQLKQNSARKN
jgi:hypothetical protein